jgi:hypothetical protein
MLSLFCWLTKFLPRSTYHHSLLVGVDVGVFLSVYSKVLLFGSL